MEILTLLATAKEAGFELGSMITLVGIYWRLESAAKKRDKAMVAKNDERWNKLISTLDTHNAINEERNQKNEERNQKNEERFTKIETHIGLK